VERKVAFKLTFTSVSALPTTGFFTCEHEYPDNLWRAELQRHDNRAVGIAAVTMIADEPVKLEDVLSAVIGSRNATTSAAGLSLPLGDAVLDVLTPASFAQRFGVAADNAGPPRCRALTLRTRDLAGLEADLSLRTADAQRIGGRLVAGSSHGVVVAFEQAR